MVRRRPDRSCLLTVNGGSSSLKFALFPATGEAILPSILRGRVERIGLHGTRAIVSPDDGDRIEQDVDGPDLAAAAGWLIGWLKANVGESAIGGVAHRVVHGGPNYSEPARITPELIAELRRVSPMDPDHLPGEIALIEKFVEGMPGVPQAACFDTAFHRDLPRVARMIPIPRRFEELGIRRYGFHGLSFSYLMQALTEAAGAEVARGRVVLAHLGSGASLAAVHQGKPVDTTMALTPAAGLVMGTRSGDIDPGLPGYLARSAGVSPEAFDRMVNHESGLLGVSGTSPDVRDLLASREKDFRANEAIELFVYSIRKGIGAMAAAMGGLDVLVFSGGIGQNAPEIRAGACEGLGFLGVELDDRANAEGAPRISTARARAEVRVIPTDEELVMAGQASAVLASMS